MSTSKIDQCGDWNPSDFEGNGPSTTLVGIYPEELDALADLMLAEAGFVEGVDPAAEARQREYTKRREAQTIERVVPTD